MDDVVDRELVRDVARVLVSRAAPEELATFDLVCDAQLAKRRRLKWPWQRDETLGFGIETVAVLLTPVAIEVATKVLSDLTAEAVKAAGHRGVQAARRLLRRLFGVQDEQPDAPEPNAELALTSDQWQHIRDDVYQAALAHHLSTDEARRLATAIGTPGSAAPDSHAD